MRKDQNRIQPKTTKKHKKIRKTSTLKLDKDAEIPTKTTYIKDVECFKINDIDINKIRVSDKKLYSKEHNSYKYYVFYEHEDKYIPLKIILKDVIGCYNDYKDNASGNARNFKLDDDSLEKIYDIFEYIERELKIDLNSFSYESKGEEYLKTKVSDKTCFKKDKDNKTNTIPNENTKYNYRVLLQMQSVYYSMKDKDRDILSDDNDDIVYYPQVLLGQCGYSFFSNNKLIHPYLIFTESEPDDNDDIVYYPQVLLEQCGYNFFLIIIIIIIIIL